MPLVAPGPELSRSEEKRYARAMALPGLGVKGQRRLRAARVLLVGVGGLGSPAASYLVGAGVGLLTIVDDDVVKVHNLHRQVLHDMTEVGRPKVASAVERLQALNPKVAVSAHNTRLTSANAARWCAEHDLVLDCTDNVATRRIIAEAAAQADRPVVWGAVSGARGYLTVLCASRGYTLDALWPDDVVDAPAAEVGAFGPAIGALGALMAGEAIKCITGLGRPLLGRVLYLDGLAGTTTEIPLAATPPPMTLAKTDTAQEAP